MKQTDYPNVSAFSDRTGVLRYRWRKQGKVKYLPGTPGSPEFNAAYKAVIAGKPIPTDNPAAELRRTFNAAYRGVTAGKPIPKHKAFAGLPRTFDAAYLAMKASKRWQALSPSTRAQYQQAAELFLRHPVIEGGSLLWGHMLVAHMKLRHVEYLLEEETIKPHTRKAWLGLLRKMILQARILEWIEADPTYGVTYNPPRTRGDRPWTDADHEKFCAAHPVGTAARTCYALARWMGNRRGDIAKLKWSDRATVRMMTDGTIKRVDGFWVEHEKGARRRQQRGEQAKVIFQPLTPMLAEILEPLDKTTETVLVTQFGQPYRKRSLTEMMRRAWIRDAGISRGHTLHGLRFALGSTMAHAEVSTKGAMDVLGHDNIKHAARYAAHADQVRSAFTAMERVTAFVQSRQSDAANRCG